MSSFKRLNKADVTTVNYHANKRWSFPNSDGTNTNTEYVVGAFGTNESFNINGTTTINDQYRSLVYAEINHLFYQSYTSSLDTGSIMFNVNTYESASQQRPTASYFNYNTNPLLIKQFPSGAGDTIGVLSINQDIYGTKILPNSFQILYSGTPPYTLIRDDGYGNLYDITGIGDDYIDSGYIASSYFDNLTPGVDKIFVGNIFYAHGIIVLTNSNYSQIIYEEGEGVPAVISFQNEHIIYENEVRCIVRESDFNLSYNPSLVSGSYESGSLYGFATSSSFNPYVTTIGLYNDDNDLLMVAKLAKPIMLSPDTDMTFIVKYDT